MHAVASVPGMINHQVAAAMKRHCGRVNFKRMWPTSWTTCLESKKPAKANADAGLRRFGGASRTIRHP
jgi:hypothetical protein